MSLLKRSVLIFLVLSSTVAFSQIPEFAYYDANEDQIANKEEFTEAYAEAETYPVYDLNEDGVITDKEFYESTYTRLDGDKDDHLSQKEWEAGHKNLYGQFVEDNYANLDADQDGKVSGNEFYEAMSQTDYFVSYDQNGDGNIDEEELVTGVYNNWDKNNDGSLDKKEYESCGKFYLGSSSKY